METLSNELKAVIGRRLQSASPQQILAYASALCDIEGGHAVEGASPNTALVLQPRFEIIQTLGQPDQVSDASTGLIWTRDHVPGGRMSWNDAKAACEKLSAGGFKWRLPTIKELLTLVDYDRNSPAIDTNIFNCESAWYWSATEYKPSPRVCAWNVSFGDGNSYWNYHNSLGFVRAVRVGQF